MIHQPAKVKKPKAAENYSVQGSRNAAKKCTVYAPMHVDMACMLQHTT